MIDQLTGKVTLPKEALAHDFLNRQPANYKSAFADLWAWANDRPRTITVGTGRMVKLLRGQLAYAQTTLARLWRWSPEKVKAFLVELQNEGQITFDPSNTTTIITVMDYTIYNPDTTPEPATNSATNPVTEPETEPATNSAQKGEVGSKKGEGAPARELPEVGIPSLSEVRTWAEMSGLCPDYVEAQWRTCAGNHAWQTKAGRLIDWRNLWLGRWLQDRAVWMAKKNAAVNGEKPATGGNGESAAQRRFRLDKELQAVRGRLEAAYETNSAPDPDDEKREREIEGELERRGA